MCLWCEVEERVYDSYQQQERKALETIRKVEQEGGGEPSDEEDGHDQRRCIWEKKLEYVVARMLRERLAIEMTDAELCSGGQEGAPAAEPRRFPAPSVPAHLLGAFERTIETLFERLATPRTSGSRRKGRTLLPFPPPGSLDS